MSDESFSALFDELGSRVAYHHFLNDPCNPLLDFEQWIAQRNLERIPEKPSAKLVEAALHMANTQTACAIVAVRSGDAVQFVEHSRD